MLIFTLALLLPGVRGLLAVVLLAAALLAAALPRLAGFGFAVFAFAIFGRAFAVSGRVAAARVPFAFAFVFVFAFVFAFVALDWFATVLSSHQIEPTVNAGASSALR